MSTTWNATTRSAALALGRVLLATLTWGDDAKTPPSPYEPVKAAAEAGQPGLEHAELRPDAGSWNDTCNVWIYASKSPWDTKGTIERQGALDGRFLEERVAGAGFGGKPGLAGPSPLGCDTGQKRSASHWPAAWEGARAPLRAPPAPRSDK